MGVSLLNNSLRKCKATQECISASDKFFTLYKDVIEHSVLSSIQKTKMEAGKKIKAALDSSGFYGSVNYTEFRNK